MVQSKKFSKKKEDFVCEHCGAHIVGNGYTNHCSVCLWSKHVDIHPGDRSAVCQGLMKPIHVESKGAGYSITHECVLCGYKKPNKVGSEDNFENLLSIVSKKTL